MSTIYDDYEFLMTTLSVQDAKPCKYCGMNKLYINREGPAGHPLQVVCQGCGARGPRTATNKEAIAEWNNPLFAEKLPTQQTPEEKD